MNLKEIRQKRKLYIDLDGVLVACEDAVAKFNGITRKQFVAAGFDSEYWFNAINNNDNEEFFANMGWEKYGKSLISWLDKNNISYSILSRPLREPNTEACIKGKIKWLQKNGLENIPAIFERDKEIYAGDGNVLIDDLKWNIDKWDAAGGVGILYSNDLYKETIKKLTELFK